MIYTEQNYRLKIEIGFSGGSMSLYNNDDLIDGWINDSQAFKSDFLLEAISHLAERNRFQARDLKKIVFADNIRSQTAHKTALSIIKGISIVQGAEVVLRDIFESIHSNIAANQKKEILIVLESKSDSYEFAKIDKNGKRSEQGNIDFPELKILLESIYSKENVDTLFAFKFKTQFPDKEQLILSLKNGNAFELDENLSIHL